MSQTARQISQIIEKIQRELNQSFSQKRMREIGEFAADKIRLRTRLGYGVSKMLGDKEKLKPIKDVTKQIRKDAKKKGILSEETSPTRSNLTFTGQMLDSLGVKKTENNSVTLYFKGTRKSTLGEPLKTNEQVARDVSRNGRPFMFLTAQDYRAVLNFVRDGFSSLIKTRLTK